MSIRDEMRSMGKGIRDTQKHIVVSEHVDYIFNNFIKQQGIFESEEAEEYIKGIKPQSIRDAVTLKLVNELNSFYVGYSTRFDDPDLGKSVLVVSNKRADKKWVGTLVSKTDTSVTIRSRDPKELLHDSEILYTVITFNLSDVDYSVIEQSNS